MPLTNIFTVQRATRKNLTTKITANSQTRQKRFITTVLSVTDEGSSALTLDIEILLTSHTKMSKT